MRERDGRKRQLMVSPLRPRLSGQSRDYRNPGENGVGLEFLGYESEFPFDRQRRHDCQGKFRFLPINFFKELSQFRALHVDPQPTIIDVVNFEMFAGCPILQGVRSKAAGGWVRQIVCQTICLWGAAFGRL